MPLLRKSTNAGILVAIVLGALVFVMFLGADGCNGCTDPESSRDALQKAGYTDIQIKEGYQFLECGEDDTFATGFIATNPRGQRVEGTVCCGLLSKGCTIRY